MKINQILIFISTAVVLYSMSSSGTIDAWWVFREKSCWADSDCHHSEYCNNFVCNNACADKNCPEAEVCHVMNHRATCGCPLGSAYDVASRVCKQEVIESRRCSENSNCESHEICEHQVCRYGCVTGGCPEHAACVTLDHVPRCYCLSGFVSESTTRRCVKEVKVAGKSCRASAECHTWEVCTNNLCISGCDGKTCGTNQVCQVNNHEAKCECLPGYAKNRTSEKCEVEDCVLDSDCTGRQRCKTTEDGIRKCECFDGEKKINGICGKECFMWVECGSNENCLNGKCECDTNFIWNNSVKSCTKNTVTSNTGRNNDS